MNRLLFLILGWLAFSAQAEEQSSLSIQLDNDILFGTDREYTGGLKIAYNDGHFKLNDWAIQPIAHFLSLASQKTTHDQLEFGAEIYTIRQMTKDRKVLASLTNTAWVYLSSKRFFHFQNHHQLPSFYHIGMKVGWIGPSNGGENIQNGFHRLIGNKAVEGWDKQPFDQPSFQISFERQSMLYQSNQKTLNLYATSWGEVGNPRTDLYLGIGAYLQHNAHPIFYHNLANHIIEKDQKWGYFAFVNGNISYDFYNLMRDGRPFTKDPSLIPQLSPWRFETRLGIGGRYQRHTLCFTVTRWQQFYDEQPESAFHFASLAYSFAL